MAGVGPQSPGTWDIEFSRRKGQKIGSRVKQLFYFWIAQEENEKSKNQIAFPQDLEPCGTEAKVDSCHRRYCPIPRVR